MSFAIVEWDGSVPPEVSIVPTNWLCLVDGDMMSYWPASAEEEKDIKKRSEPKKTWKKYIVRQIGKAGNFTSYMHYVFALICWDISNSTCNLQHC